MPGVGVNRPGADTAGPFRPVVDGISTFFDYQFNPEKYLKPGQRLKPGPMQGYQYDLQPGESQTDSGVTGPDGQPVQFVNRPKLATLADLVGYMVGGVAGAPKGAMGAGAYRTVRDPGPSILAEDPTAVRDLALKMEAMHKRGAQGYDLTKAMGSKEGLDKADKALSRVSTSDPLPRYQDAAQRAMDMGFDTPAFHVTNVDPDPEVIRKLAGTPWREMDPFVTNRGAFYLGDFNRPTGPLRSGAALNTFGGARAYPFLIKDVLGESVMPPSLHTAMPDVLQFDKWGGIPKDTLGDVRDAMQSVPGWGDNMAAAMEATKRYLGPGNFDPATFMMKQGEARNTIGELLSRLYYEQAPGAAPGTMQKIDPFAFRPVAAKDPNLPHYSTVEGGARMTKGDTPGIHSPFQNELGSVGFSGVRVRDEQTPYGFKSYAMIDPTGVRAVGAKFKNPNGDLLSGNAPPGWWLDIWKQNQQEQNPQ